jgi:hypothetical protein
MQTSSQWSKGKEMGATTLPSSPPQNLLADEKVPGSVVSGAKVASAGEMGFAAAGMTMFWRWSEK